MKQYNENCKYSILIVDDMPEIREIISEGILDECDVNIYEAKDSFEALEIIRHNKINLLITDIKLPGMDGISLTESLISIIDYDLDVILITGFSNIDVNSLSFSIVGLFYKPINLSSLVELVRALCYE